MTTAITDPAVPRAGMLATVRNRRGVVAAVQPFDGEKGRLHLVHLEYTGDHAPAEERLLWELEPSRHLLEPNALPDPAHAGGPMSADDFDALLRAARWTALSPYLDPGDGDGRARREPIASPFHGGVRIESYQLVPLLKALRMPRVNLLIADDVGLGKTVEAGLILTELLLRRRIQRVLVLTPASLRHQWREELWDKFSLRFEVVDRQGTERLRRGLGMDATPWRSFSRIVASYHYLRQPDVLEQFLAASRPRDDSPHLPWDLLIVDECHNLMPSPFGEDSELCRMLRLVAPRFEHRLFLSATPHNGHTRSFTGLLEMLDPVRFSRTSEMSPAMRGRIEDVVVRRLKRDINARSTTPRFCNRRPPKALALDPERREADLSAAFDAFRAAVRTLVARGPAPRRRTGAFAVEILGKRLLSCPTAFAESWSRTRQGLSGAEPATEKDVAAAERTLRQETGDDREAQQREATAATVAGAWLRNFAGDLDAEIRDIEGTLDALGFDLDAPITGADAGSRCAVRCARGPDRPAADGAPWSRPRRRGEPTAVPARRAPDRVHRVQDHARLPDPPPARAVPRRPCPHLVRQRRPGRDGPGRPGARQGRVQRPGVAGGGCSSPPTPHPRGSTCTAPRAICSTTTARGTRRGSSSATAASTATARPAT